MKKYQKAQMIAKNLPTGSYAAGCPQHHYYVCPGGDGHGVVAIPGQGTGPCSACELAS